MKLAIVAALVVAAVMSSSAQAFAAACCGDGASLGRRLASDEAGAATLATTYTGRFGGYSGEGTYRGLADGDHDHLLRLDVGYTVRAASRLELGVVIPLQVDFRSLGGTSATGGGFADISTSLRVEALRVTSRSPWPAIFLTSTVVVPTGRPASLAPPLGAGVTGEGVPELRAELGLEKSFFDRWFANVSGSVGLLGHSDVDGVSVGRAPRFVIGATTGPIFLLGGGRGIAAGLGVRYEAEGAASIDGGSSGSARTRFDIVGSGAFDLTLRVALLASFESELPASRLGQNELARGSLSLGVRIATGL